MKTRNAYNPYLPFWETVPDGEPHVFDGRIYIFGSHDRLGGSTFCSDDFVVWSAPVDDPGNWRCDGVSYRAEQDPYNGAPYTHILPDGTKREHAALPESIMPPGTKENPHLLYAPDVCQGPDGRFYLYYALDFVSILSVAVADRPEGPYAFLDYCLTEDGRNPEPGIRFDPAILSDATGNYLYYGFCPRQKYPGQENVLTPGSLMVRLADDMHTIISEPVLIANGCDTAEGTGFAEHPFFEASSIRHFGKWYYFVYSSVQMNELCYAMAERPEGPFTYKGVIISNGDIGYKGRTTPVNFMGNNHGGLVQFGGKTYIFWHRQTHGDQYSRQGCADEVQILADGTIPQTEVTSCGLNGGPLPAKGTYETYIYSYLTKPDPSDQWSAILMNPGDAKAVLPADWPYLTEEKDPEGEHGLRPYITNLQAGAVVGFKYFAFDGTEKSLAARLRGSGVLELRLDAPDGKRAAAIAAPGGADWITGQTPLLTKVEGVHAVYFAAADGPSGADLDFASFAFSEEETEA